MADTDMIDEEKLLGTEENGDMVAVKFESDHEEDDEDKEKKGDKGW